MAKVEIKMAFGERQLHVMCENPVKGDILARKLCQFLIGGEYNDGYFRVTPEHPKIELRHDAGLITTVAFEPSADDATPEEMEALKEFAAHYGPHWKNTLKREWQRGGTIGILQRIRNERGPIWLGHFKLPKEAKKPT